MSDMRSALARADVEVLDSVDLFDDIGEMEVGRERPYQFHRVHQVGRRKSRRQVPAGVDVTVAAQGAGEGSHPFHQFEEGVALLADDRLSELRAQTPNVVAQRLIGCVFGHRFRLWRWAQG